MAESTTIPDFATAWRDWLTQSERQWNDFFNKMMGTEEFGEGLGRNLDLFLHFQKTMNEAMGSYFMTMNIPTRADVLELGERLMALENRLAGIEASLLSLSSSKGPANEGDAPKPRRTKKPAPRNTAEN